MTKEGVHSQSRSDANSFADRYEHLCRHVILPALRSAVIRRAQARPSPVLFHVADESGRTTPTTDASVHTNRRVALRTTPNIAELSFVAWEPYVLVWSRRGCALSRHHRLEEITPTLVEETAREFMNGIPVREASPPEGRR
jgi:hypothetical protein